MATKRNHPITQSFTSFTRSSSSLLYYYALLPICADTNTMLRSLTRHATSRGRSCFAAATTSSSTPNQSRNIHIEKKITDLKIELPTAPLPKANYNIICLPPGDDNIMYVSGHLPIKVSVGRRYDIV